MNCESAKTQLPDYLDGELDRRAVADLEQHLAQCPECMHDLTSLEQLRKTLRDNLPRYKAPAALRTRLEQAATQSELSARESPQVAYRYWKIAASVLLAYLLGAATIWYTGNASYQDDQKLFAQSLLNSHLRALVASSPVDVVSSNRHVVKPWFAGRIAITPPVADFAEEGFPLVGGRIDYVGGERAAVLTYSHGPHLIDVYFLPPTNAIANRASRVNGYSLTPIRLVDQSAWMVTDMDEHESGRFRQLIAVP